MNEEQKFEVGNLVKMRGWKDYRPIESINGEYISFVNTETIQWYNTFKNKFIKYVEKENAPAKLTEEEKQALGL